jgi:hypothetical protein
MDDWAAADEARPETPCRLALDWFTPTLRCRQQERAYTSPIWYAPGEGGQHIGRIF